MAQHLTNFAMQEIAFKLESTKENIRGAIVTYNGKRFLLLPDKNFGCFIGLNIQQNAKSLSKEFGDEMAFEIATQIQEQRNSNKSNNNPRLKEMLDKPWGDALRNLVSTRAYNALSSLKSVPLRDLVNMSRAEIFAIPNMGVETKRNVAAALRTLGVQNSEWFE